ncbi:MAG: hypothetical protein ACRETF_10190 [Nevskiaceae bacterium]
MSQTDGEKDLLAKVAAMPEPDRTLARPFALKGLTAAEEARVVALVKKALS